MRLRARPMQFLAHRDILRCRKNPVSKADVVTSHRRFYRYTAYLD